MGAIGDYVHYSLNGYLEHGITKNQTFQSYKSQKDIIRKKAKSSAKQIKDVDLKKMEEAIMAIMRAEAEDNSAVATARNNVSQYLNSLFTDLQSYDFATGKFSLTGSKTSRVGQARSYYDVEDILKRLNKTEQAIMEAIKEGQVNEADIRERIDNLKNYYAKVQNDINKFKTSKGWQKSLTVKQTQQLKEQRRELNKLIKEFAAYPAVALQQGTFFEAVLDQLPLVAKEALTSEIRGDIPEIVAMDKTKFANQYITKDFGDLLERTSVSQGKVDVSVMWNETPVNISAKSVDLNNYYIHLVTGSSLLYMIQDLNSNFVNHFLNIFAAHKGSSSRLSQMKLAMAQEMKLILMYKALTGDNYKRTSANVFAVNDINTGKVRLFDMYTLIDKVSKDQQGIMGIQLNKKTFNENIKFNNSYAATPDERISRLLTDVHNRKVSVSINTKYIKF